MNNIIKKSMGWTVSIISFVFTVVPETVFSKVCLSKVFSYETNVIINRIVILLLIFVISLIITVIYYWRRKKVVIKGKNYQIQIEYGDIFEYKKSKKVITFDECFTTCVGDLPDQIKPTSICGQFLVKNPTCNITKLISHVQLKPAKGKSDYNKQDKYESGRLLLYKDYLLMAIAKLDKSGLGKMTRDEYIKALSVLWEEINKYYGQTDVCVPIIGSGLTRIDGSDITQQELLDIMISSYKLSTYKIKNPQKLHIVCKKQADFSLNRIGENL